MVDISYGGNFFAMVEAEQIGDINTDQLDKFVCSGMEILQALQDYPVQHPNEKHITSIDLVDFSGPPHNPPAHATNLAIFGNRQVDRSPCGTGTSAKMATLYARGELGLHEKFCTESVLGTYFTGELIEEVMVGNLRAVIPLITGSAYITAISHVVLDINDPLKQGFCIPSA